MTDVIIIGGGPAGLTAGIYCTRAGLATLLLESGAFGGQLATAGLVENYPGIILPGAELAEQMLEQAQQSGVQILNTAVTDLDLKNKAVTANNTVHHCACIIFATGAAP